MRTPYAVMGPLSATTTRRSWMEEDCRPRIDARGGCVARACTSHFELVMAALRVGARRTSYGDNVGPRRQVLLPDDFHYL